MVRRRPVTSRRTPWRRSQAVVAPREPVRVTAAGSGGRSIRRTVAYALLIGYAILMMIPFAWQLITSFKTDRDALRLTIVPQPFTLAGLGDRAS